MTEKFSLIPLFRQNRRQGLLILAAWLVVRALVITGGLLLKSVFDALAEPANTQIWTLLAVLTAVMAVQTVLWFDVIMARLEIPLAMRVAAQLRVNTMASLMDRPAATAVPTTIGDATGRLGTDVDEIRRLPIWSLAAASRICSAVVMLAIMCWLSPVVTLGLLPPFVLVLVAARLMDTTVGRYRSRSREAAARVGSVIAESIRASAVVKALGNQRHVVDRMRSLNLDRERLTVRDRTFSETQASLSWLASTMSGGLIMILAASQSSAGRLSVGDLALFVYFSGMVAEVVLLVGMATMKVRQSKVSLDRIGRLTSPQSPLMPARTYLDVAAPSPVAPPPAEPLKSLHVKAPGFELRLAPGTLTVLTGPVGCGKTTALRAVLGLVSDHSAVVRWNGQVVPEPHRFMVSPRVGYVPQAPTLFTGTVADNIRLGIEGDVTAAADTAVLTEDLAELPDGLDTLVGVGGRRLSGGQTQRVALARALMRRPRLLVLDDVDSALDALTARTMWRRLLSDPGLTILAVSHNVYVQDRADTVIRLP